MISDDPRYGPRERAARRQMRLITLLCASAPSAFEGFVQRSVAGVAKPHRSVDKYATRSLTSRGLRMSPIGGIADTAFVRSAISDFAIRRSAGGVPAEEDDIGRRLLLQRSVDPLAVLERDSDRSVARRDARARLEQRLEDLVARQALSDSGQVGPDIRAGIAHGVAARALGGGILDERVLTAPGAAALEQRVAERHRERRRAFDF